jgi:hypothetical protein
MSDSKEKFTIYEKDGATNVIAGQISIIHHGTSRTRQQLEVICYHKDVTCIEIFIEIYDSNDYRKVSYQTLYPLEYSDKGNPLIYVAPEENTVFEYYNVYLLGYTIKGLHSEIRF